MKISVLRKMKYIFLSLVILFLPLPLFSADDDSFARRNAGRIFLQVEEHGEAWYVNPENLKRYFLGRPQDAFNIMQKQGRGVTNLNLNKIPVGLVASYSQDSDRDGLSDDLEKALGLKSDSIDTDGDGFTDKAELISGYNPMDKGSSDLDMNFAKKNAGQIFLQVEQNGEAWYIHPSDYKRYYLGRPADAFNIMRSLGVGISNKDLEKIMALTPGYLINPVENDLYVEVNKEREINGLKPLVWNDELAAVARAHSKNLAKENEAITSMEKSCDYPIIHHEGLNFGLYNGERLNNKGIYYYNKAGENIALMSAASYKVEYTLGDGVTTKISECQNTRSEWDAFIKKELEEEDDEMVKIELIKEELAKRAEKIKDETAVSIVEINWRDKQELAIEIVQGWMDSPGHRRNILDGDYDETGMGAVYVNGYIIATQVFIKRVGCGYQDGKCCEKEGYYPYCYVPLECRNNYCVK